MKKKKKNMKNEEATMKNCMHNVFVEMVRAICSARSELRQVLDILISLDSSCGGPEGDGNEMK